MEHLSPSFQQEKGLKIFRQAFKSEFYNEKYSHIGLQPNISDWLKIPVLTRDEIYANSFPRSSKMLTQNLEGMIVISTGGSSGVSRYTTYTHAEWDDFVNMQSEAMRILGIKPSDKIANLFIAGHFWPSFVGLHDCIKKINAVHLPISANIPPEEIVKLCLEFEPTVMVSLPTLFVFLADMAVRDGFEFKKLRMINYAGEHLSLQAEAHIKKALKVDNIKSGAYTSADAGIMGYQCHHCPPGVYHVPTAFQFIEIMNFETGTYCKPNEEGEVIVTNLSRLSTPILRYRVGDAALWTGDICPCGDRNPLLKLAGRAGQDFKIGGGFISLSVFDEVIAELSDAFSLNYQLILEDEANKLRIKLMIETPVKVTASQLKALKEALFSKVPEFRIGVEKGYIASFEIEAVALGSLPRSPITGKVKKLDDKRVK